MRKIVDKSVGWCSQCGGLIKSDVQCNCEMMRDKVDFNRKIPLKTDHQYGGAFYQAFINIARQFMDIRSHLVLLATCKHFYDLYHDHRELSRTSTQFAFAQPVNREFKDAVCWHENPVITVTSDGTIFKLENRVLKKTVFKELVENPELLNEKIYPAFQKTYPGFQIVKLPDGLQGKIKGFFISYEYFAVWTADNQLYFRKKRAYPGVDYDDCRITHSLVNKIVKIIPGTKNPIIIADGLYEFDFSDVIPITKYTGFYKNAIDVVFYHSAVLLLTNDGKIFVEGIIKSDSKSPHLPDGEYKTPTPMFTAITDKIIGIAKQDDLMVAWTEKKVFATDENFKHLAMPEISGKIIQLKIAKQHILVLTDQGEVYSAGSNDSWQLGRKIQFFNGFKGDFDPTFKKVDLPNTIVSIAAGGYGESFFMSYDGRVFMCGSYDRHISVAERLNDALSSSNDAYPYV